MTKAHDKIARPALIGERWLIFTKAIEVVLDILPLPKVWTQNATLEVCSRQWGQCGAKRLDASGRTQTVNVRSRPPCSVYRYVIETRETFIAILDLITLCTLRRTEECFQVLMYFKLHPSLFAVRPTHGSVNVLPQLHCSRTKAKGWAIIPSDLISQNAIRLKAFLNHPPSVKCRLSVRLLPIPY